MDIELFITCGTDIESYFVRIEHLCHCLNEITKEELNALLKEAKREKKNKAIEMLKLKEFGQKHQDKSSHLDAYFDQCYEDNEDTLFHGKEVYRKIKSLYQEKYKSNAVIEKSSPQLLDEKLVEIANKIWV